MPLPSPLEPGLEAGSERMSIAEWRSRIRSFVQTMADGKSALPDDTDELHQWFFAGIGASKESAEALCFGWSLMELEEVARACMEEISALCEHVESDPRAEAMARVLTEVVLRGEEPTLFERSPLDGQLRMAAIATRLPVAEASVEGSAFQFLVSLNNVRFDDGTFRPDEELFSGFLEKVRTLPLADQLDILHFCHSLHAGAAQGVHKSIGPDRTLERLDQIIDAVEASRPGNLFIRYEAALARESIRDTERHPPSESVDMTARRGAKREKDDTERRLIPEKEQGVPPGWRVQRAAKDAVMLVDRSGLPRAFAAVDSPLESRATVPPLAFRREIDRLNGTTRLSLADIGRIHECLVAAVNDPDAAAAFWQDVFPLADGEWSRLLQAASALRDERKNARLWRRGLHEQRDTEEIEVFNDTLARTHADLRRRRADGWPGIPGYLQPELIEAVDRSEGFWREGRLDRAMDELKKALVVVNHCATYRYSITQSLVQSSAPKELEPLETAVQILRNREEQEVRELTRTSKRRQQAIVAPVAPILDAVAGDETVPERLQAALEELGREQSEGLPHVRFHDFGALPTHGALVPFADTWQTEDALLLQHLLRPPMRERIEKDLGVDLRELSLSTLIHLFRFLQHATDETFGRLAAALHEHADAADDMLTCFLACAEDVNMGNTLLDLAERGNSAPIFRAYAAMVGNIEHTAGEVARLHGGLHPEEPLTAADVYRSLITHANGITRDALGMLPKDAAESDPSIAESMARRIHHENERIALTSALVTALPAGAISRLNLNILETVEMETVPASELLTRDDLRSLCDEMTLTIKTNFRPGDDMDFKERFLLEPTAKVTYATCAGKLLSFFGTSRMPDGTQYLDWYNTSPKSPIKGLAEATAYTALNDLQKDQDFYLVAKPHVRSHEIFSRVGFVTYGTSDAGEYQHRYLRCRRLHEEENENYIGKQLTPEEIATIGSACAENNAMYALPMRGVDLQVCRVEYAGIDHENDIAPGTPDDFIFQQVASLCANNAMVMTAYIPDKKNGGKEWRKQKRQAYYCVFEKSTLKPERAAALGDSVHAFHEASVTSVAEKKPAP